MVSPAPQSKTGIGTKCGSARAIILQAQPSEIAEHPAHGALIGVYSDFPAPDSSVIDTEC
jgi:hypothetical protein